MEIVGYVASLFIGLILGLIGGGGSILSIPILVYIFRLDPVIASAYSLFIVGITSLAGAIPKYRDHLVNVKTGLLFGIPSIVAIFITRKWIVPAIPDVLVAVEGFALTRRLLLLGVFATLMVLASVSMIRDIRVHDPESRRFAILFLVVEGIVIGFLTGLVGAGGGFLIIPALVLLTGLPFKTAVGTSLFIIAINSLAGFTGDLLTHRIDWPFLLSITAIAVAGIIVGHSISRWIPAQRLRYAFGWFVLLTGIYILGRELLVTP